MGNLTRIEEHVTICGTKEQTAIREMEGATLIEVLVALSARIVTVTGELSLGCIFYFQANESVGGAKPHVAIVVLPYRVEHILVEGIDGEELVVLGVEDFYIGITVVVDNPQPSPSVDAERLGASGEVGVREYTAWYMFFLARSHVDAMDEACRCRIEPVALSHTLHEP